MEPYEFSFPVLPTLYVKYNLPSMTMTTEEFTRWRWAIDQAQVYMMIELRKLEPKENG